MDIDMKDGTVTAFLMKHGLEYAITSRCTISFVYLFLHSCIFNLNFSTNI